MSKLWPALCIATIIAALPGPAGAQQGSSEHKVEVELLSDTKGADLTPYMRTLIAGLKAQWVTALQNSSVSRGQSAAHPVIRFNILPSGATGSVRMVYATDSAELDGAAWDAVTAAKAGALPAPLNSPLDLQVTFE